MKNWLISEKAQTGRELYLAEGLVYVPRILELADRNRLSRTYGCFDRQYWHYRTSDFPSGMYQEAVLPLALAYLLDVPGNPYYRVQRLKDAVLAGIDYARRSSHRDGSCDDYFPYERAAGATAFSLYAATEASLLMGLENRDFEEFFCRRARYLVKHGMNESGILSNHKALIVLALHNVFLVTRDAFFRKQAEAALKQLLNLQSSEGWFPEYEGSDPGYLAFTIDFLAKYYAKSADERVIPPLVKAAEFASYFMHPDGSYGGEYGSRGTFHFLPHGFELLARQTPAALETADLFLRGLRDGRRSYIDDDRIFIHYAYNFLQAYRDYCPRPEAGPSPERPPFEGYFPLAQLFVRADTRSYAVFSTAKGGVGKLFKDGNLVLSDTGLAGKTRDGRAFTSHTIAPSAWKIEDGRIVFEGHCYETKQIIFNPMTFIGFRAFTVLIARFLSPNLIRRWFQKKAILNRPKKLPLRFVKSVPLDGTGAVTFHLQIEDEGLKISELWSSTDATHIYVATSQPYQQGALMPWIDLSPALDELNRSRQAVFTHLLP